MDGIAAVNSAAAGDEAGSLQIALLKKSQDLMAQEGAALVASLPPPPQAPSPPGVGGHIDIKA
jgi:hypothetical protein